MISSKVRLFVDDCLIYIHIKNKQDQIKIQKGRNLLKKKYAWGMRLNVAKYNDRVMGTRSLPLQLLIDMTSTKGSH